MNKKLRKIIAIIALVFAAIFVVSFNLYLINDQMLGGTIGTLALSSAAFMFVLFLVIKFDDKANAVNESNEKMVEEEKKERAEKDKKQASAPKEGEIVEHSALDKPKNSDE